MGSLKLNATVIWIAYMHQGTHIFYYRYCVDFNSTEVTEQPLII